MYPDDVPIVDNTNYTTIDHYRRKQAIKSQYTQLSDISEFIRAHPKIQYRYLVQASKDPLAEYELLNFTEENAKQGISLGIKDAKASIEMGPGVAFDRFLRKNRNLKEPAET